MNFKPAYLTIAFFSKAHYENDRKIRRRRTQFALKTLVRSEISERRGKIILIKHCYKKSVFINIIRSFWDSGWTTVFFTQKLWLGRPFISKKNMKNGMLLRVVWSVLGYNEMEATFFWESRNIVSMNFNPANLSIAFFFSEAYYETDRKICHIWTQFGLKSLARSEILVRRGNNILIKPRFKKYVFINIIQNFGDSGRLIIFFNNKFCLGRTSISSPATMTKKTLRMLPRVN